MKKLLFMSAAAFCMCTLSVTFTSCGNDDEKPAPEPAPPTPQYQTVSFEGNYFTALIDNPQNNGPQLYPSDPEAPLYTWTDETTTLSSTLTGAYGDNKFWGGGIAISNYIDADIANHADPDHQLSVPKSNGSTNFAVVFCTAYLKLNEAKVIKNMDVTPTTYTLGVIKNGNAYAKALTEPDSYLEVIVKGFNKGKATATVRFDLALDGTFLEEWKTIDMSKLQAVDSIAFEMEGSDIGDWGLNSPQYFAIDNVVIEK